ncbi:hypothetical protein U1Q18_049730, partial [Sarracenia purpurea var. burkii]
MEEKSDLMPGIPADKTFLEAAFWRDLRLLKISSPLEKLLPKQAREMTSPEKLLMSWSIIISATPPAVSIRSFHDSTIVFADS